MNAISQEVPAIHDVSTVVQSREGNSVIIAAASMSELVTLGRLFLAYINERPGYTGETAEKMDEDMGVLAEIDDEISALISERAPKDVAEYGLKSAYLFARLRRDNMADDVKEMALAALERDARAMAGLPAAIAA